MTAFIVSSEYKAVSILTFLFSVYLWRNGSSPKGQCDPGSQVTKQKEVLPQDLMKPWRRVIGI